MSNDTDHLYEAERHARLYLDEQRDLADYLKGADIRNDTVADYHRHLRVRLALQTLANGGR